MTGAILTSRGTPGYEIFTDTAGVTIPVVSVFSRLYLLIDAEMVTPQTQPGEWVTVGSMDDFTNLFGSSDAIVLDSIETYLLNYPTGLYVARAVPSEYVEVTVDIDPTAKTITIGGTVITYTPDATPTLQEIITNLVTLINDEEDVNLDVEAEYFLNANGTINYTDGKFRIRDKTGAGLPTITGSIDVIVGTETTPENLQYWDWVAAIRNIALSQIGGEAMDEQPLGFLSVPQAFLQLDNQFERDQVANTIDEVCRKLSWAAFLDPHDPLAIDHPRKAKTDTANYNAPQGHTEYTYPYFINRDLDLVAPSVAIASAALRRYQRQGIQQPPCGEDCIIDGISGVQFALNQAQKVDLADSKVSINVYQRGRGAMSYDCLTRSVDPAFQFMHTRVILSSFERTLRDTLRASRLLHRAVDGEGRFYSQLRLTVIGVCELFYQAGALYGETRGDAYYVQCNAALQNATNLEQGVVRFNAYLVPVPIARRILGYVYRVAIDQIAQTVAIESGVTV